MPLQLSADASTDRPQRVLWDPANEDEAADARRRKAMLLAQGFILKMEAAGEALLEPPPTEEHVRILRILSKNGDDRVVWDRRNADQVREAFAKFKELLQAGYTAFTVLAGGERGHKLTEFDPGLEEIFFAAKEVVAIPRTMPG